MTRAKAGAVGKRSRDEIVVVHLLGRLNPGGAEYRLLDLLRRRTSGERHVFVALSGLPGALDKEFEALGHQVVHRSLSPSFPAWYVPFLRRVKATHVHSHVHLASGYLLALAVIARVPNRIAHVRSTGDGQRDTWRRRAYRRLGRLLIGWVATDVICVSRAVANATFGTGLRRGRAPVRVLYSKIDGSRFHPPTGAKPVGDSPRLIAVGRLDAEKNPLRAMEILAALRTRRPNASLTFVGRSTPTQRQFLDRNAYALGLGQSVKFLGETGDIASLLAQSDVLLTTTTREGLPGAVIESAAAGVPAVVSNIGPNEEVAVLLPSVVPVPLAANDDAWCDVIEGVLDARTGHFKPMMVRFWFDQSPFTLLGCRAEEEPLWE